MRLICVLSALSLAASACSLVPSDDPQDGFIVDDSKADDFLSAAASEFVIEGTSFVTVEEGEGMPRALELIQLKHVSISWFLNDFLIEEEDEATGVVSGFGAMVKTGDFEDLNVRQLNARSFEFTFRQMVVGKKNLSRNLGLDSSGRFAIEIGKPSNEEMALLEVNKEWYRKAPWKPWKPETMPASKKELIQLKLSPEKPTPDAWWDYQRLIEDDVLRIDAHFGWDFIDDLHIKHSAKFYNFLINEHGFDSPVASVDDYDRNSGPLTKIIEADGREVEVEVRIYWGHPGTSTDTDTDSGGALLERDLRRSLNKADIIAFEGHSGPFFGFPMANWKKTDEGDLDDSEMPFIDMPADKYQIVFGEGCDTLMIGPALLNNVNKQGKNIDIVTTTALSDSDSTPINNFLARLLERDSQGRHRPRTVRGLLVDLDSNAMYGVHGVNDNPRVHPYARQDLFCSSCDSNTDCGGAGNSCIRIGDSGRSCTAACTTDEACGEGFSCEAVASQSSGTIFARMCAPSTLTCE